MVNGNVPLVVLVVVVTVIVVDPAVVTDDGLKLELAPVGNPLALKVTVPVKPLIGETVTVYVVLSPRLTVCEEGVAEIEKSGAVAWTTSVAVEVRVRVPLVPVIVKGYVPAGVLALVVTESAADAPVVGFGLKVPVAPAGRPLMDSITAPVNPPVLVMFSV